MVSNEARNVGKDMTPVYRPLSQTLYYTPHKSLASGPNGYFVVSLGDQTSKVWCYAPSTLKRLLCHSLSSQPTRAYVKHLHMLFRGTQREYSSKPLKYSIVERILLFKR